MCNRIVAGMCLLIGLFSMGIWPGPLSVQAGEPQTEWKAGTASCVITPNGPMWMAGYAARDKPSDGKVHDLNAKALAIEDAQGTRLVIVTLDLISITPAIRDWLEKQVAQHYQLPAGEYRAPGSRSNSLKMLRNLIAFPLLALVVIIQSAVISRITLLSGCADLVLIVLAVWALKAKTITAWVWAFLASMMVSFVSEMPWLVVFTGYSIVILIAQLLQQRVWQAPLLAAFSVIFVGTFIMNIFALLVLNLLGRPLPFGESLGLVVLPSVLLNLLFAIPVYVMMRDLAQWAVPEQEIE